MRSTRCRSTSPWASAASAPGVVAALTAGRRLVGQRGQPERRQPQPAVHPLARHRVQVRCARSATATAPAGSPAQVSRSASQPPATSPTCGSASQLSAQRRDAGAGVREAARDRGVAARRRPAAPPRRPAAGSPAPRRPPGCRRGRRRRRARPPGARLQLDARSRSTAGRSRSPGSSPHAAPAASPRRRRCSSAGQPARSARAARRPARPRPGRAAAASPSRVGRAVRSPSISSSNADVVSASTSSPATPAVAGRDEAPGRLCSARLGDPARTPSRARASTTWASADETASTSAVAGEPHGLLRRARAPGRWRPPRRSWRTSAARACTAPDGVAVGVAEPDRPTRPARRLASARRRARPPGPPAARPGPRVAPASAAAASTLGHAASARSKCCSASSGGPDPHRLVAGADRPRQHLRGVLGLGDVVRDLGGADRAAGPGLEGAGVRRVQPGTLARQQVVVHRRAQQVVREGVAGALRRSTPRPRRHAAPRRCRPSRQPGDVPQQPVRAPRRATTAAQRTTARASSGSASSRPTSRSARARRSRASGPAIDAGSARSRGCHRSGAGPRRRSALACPSASRSRYSATSSRPNGSRSSRRTAGSRPSSPTSRRTRGRAARPSVRTVATHRSRSALIRLSRNRRKSADDASTHCRSSTTTTTGPRSRRPRRAGPRGRGRTAARRGRLVRWSRPLRDPPSAPERPQQVGDREVRQTRVAQVDALRPQRPVRPVRSVEQRADQPGLAHARLTGDQDRAGRRPPARGHHLVQDRAARAPDRRARRRPGSRRSSSHRGTGGPGRLG